MTILDSAIKPQYVQLCAKRPHMVYGVFLLGPIKWNRYDANQRAVKTFVPVYVPVGVPPGTSKPQNVAPATFVVDVGWTRLNPVTVTFVSVS